MKLTTKQRNAMPASEFALPAQRKYPVNDKSHAGLAKGRAAQQFNRGNLSSGMKAAIDAKANRVIGHPFHTIPPQAPAKPGGGK